MQPAITTTTSPSAQLDRVLFSRSSTDASRADFSAIIGRMNQGADETPAQLSRRTAEQFVSMALVQPLLSQLRSSNNAAPPFAPSQGEKQFQSLMDAEVAQRIVRAAHFPLVDRLAQDMLNKVQARQASDRQPATQPSTPDSAS